MHRSTVTRGFPPVLLLLLALAVVLMLSGAHAFGFAFGLVVAGMAGIALVSMVLYDVARNRDHRRPSTNRRHRKPRARRF